MIAICKTCLLLKVCNRGRGIGRSLIEAVYAEADKRGSPSVYWLTEETNKQARALYDKVANATSFIEYSR